VTLQLTFSTLYLLSVLEQTTLCVSSRETGGSVGCVIILILIIIVILYFLYSIQIIVIGVLYIGK